MGLRINPLESPIKSRSQMRRAVCHKLRLIAWCKRLKNSALKMSRTSRKSKQKNGLENYCFTMRNTLNEEKLKEKFEGGDKEKIEKAVQDTLDWLDKNQLAEKDKFEAKQKELEGVVNPIMMKVYQAAGGGAGMPEGGMPGRDGSTRMGAREEAPCMAQ